MQRILLLLPAALGMLRSHAADLTVAIGGTAPVFPSINAAISAAVDGDRILVQPGTYPAFAVNKSVEILALSLASGFAVSGDVSVYTAPNRKLTLSGANVMGKLLHPDAGVNPTQISITATNCTFQNVELPMGYTLVQLHGCTVKGRLVFARGAITVCRIQGSPAHMSASASVVELTSTGPSQRRYLVGNIIGELIPSTYTPNVVSLETDAPFTCSNNYVHASASAAAKPVVKTKKPKENYLVVTLEECLVSSFSIGSGTGSKPWMEDSVSMFEPDFTALLQNNFIVNALPFTGNANCFPQAYNVVTTSAGTIDPLTGQPTAGSPAINAGDPSTAYLDLDLSRNDAGCWGGSWSMANFQGGNGPQLMLVQAPRSAVSGSTIAVNASAIQR